VDSGINDLSHSILFNLFQTLSGANGFSDANGGFLKRNKLKIVVGDRANCQKIDCFILSSQLSTIEVETFDVDLKTIGHYPVGLRVAFDDLKVRDVGAAGAVGASDVDVVVGDGRRARVDKVPAVRRSKIGAETSQEPAPEETKTTKTRGAARSTATSKTPVETGSERQPASNGAKKTGRTPRKTSALDQTPPTPALPSSSPAASKGTTRRRASSKSADKTMPQNRPVPKAATSTPTRKPRQAASSPATPKTAKAGSKKASSATKAAPKDEVETEIRRARGQNMRQSQAN